MSGSRTDHDAVFRDLVDHLRAVFWVASPDRSAMLYCSPAYEELWGRTVASLYDAPRSRLDAVHPDDRARVVAAWDGAPADYDVEYRVVRPDGAVTHVHDRGHAVHASDGSVLRVVGIATDVTEVKRLEEQLLHAQKMESLGRLAGGVAHEVNNLLTIVLGQARLARERPAEGAARLTAIEDDGAARRRADGASAGPHAHAAVPRRRARPRRGARASRGRCCATCSDPGSRSNARWSRSRGRCGPTRTRSAGCCRRSRRTPPRRCRTAACSRSRPPT